MFTVEVVWGTERKRLSAESGINLLKLLKREGMEIPSPCGGKGFCGKCKVQILKGDKTRTGHSPSEMDHLTAMEIQEGYRLACHVLVEEDLSISYGDGKKDEATILIDGKVMKTSLQPAVQKVFLELALPSVHDQRSDGERLLDAMGPGTKLKRDILRELPEVLRDNDYKVTVTKWLNEVIHVEGGNKTDQQYGVAVDIGTTTMVGYLLDLNTGSQLDVYSMLNPQRSYGADVITRTDYTVENANGLEFLSGLVHQELNRMLEVFEERQSIRKENIYQMVVVGNTIMMHIFAGLPVRNIAVSPFIPVYSRGFSLDTREMGLRIHPNGKIHLLPCVAGYVGADTIAAVMASGMDQNDDISLLIDIGTNGEIALGNREKIVACSTAAGPAFEGAHIRHGLGGVRGAISKVELRDDGVSYVTIGGDPARGICGSGIVDVVSEMKNIGLIDIMGRIQDRDSIKVKKIADRIVPLEDKPAFLLVSKEEGATEDIYIYQKDLREVQLAKAAIASGIRILMKEMNISFDQIDHVYLAGGFGNYIDYKHACNIGLLPLELQEKLASIGNGAGVGAKMALLFEGDMNRAEEIRKKTQYVELSTRMDFQEVFVEMLMF
ncbi:MAG: ASKHA domain-containing protein [Clostridia bacterium]